MIDGEYLSVRQRELSGLLNITQSRGEHGGRIQAEELKLNFEPKQRAHSQPKVPPISMAGGLAAGLASELKTDSIPYGRIRLRRTAACGGKLQI
jgi:hypothetical protein